MSQESRRAAVLGDLEAKTATALSQQGWGVTLMRRDGADLGDAGRDIQTAHYGDGIPLPDDHEDLIVLVDALEYAVDDVALLAEARRVLRPKGLLTVRVPLAGRLACLDGRNIRHYITETSGRGSPFPEMAGVGFRRHYDRPEVTDLIIAAGFAIQHARSSAFGLSELVYLGGSTLFHPSSGDSRFASARRLYAKVDRLETRLPFGSYYLTIVARRIR